ncbi:hypothetical protein B1207_07440 [Legionella quinlivanii]|uniref:Uncharacterized protein n=1 Tax=Legionella quinlivanii TaxID=45073 RepID=A0A364LJE7_9GAMM|nr:hypothetical protein [Legionella quinlivanii]RAP36630.1 hypothetical protein B1207_07440 [Legionella quinlivanii]
MAGQNQKPLLRNKKNIIVMDNLKKPWQELQALYIRKQYCSQAKSPESIACEKTIASLNPESVSKALPIAVDKTTPNPFPRDQKLYDFCNNLARQLLAKNPLEDEDIRNISRAVLIANQHHLLAFLNDSHNGSERDFLSFIFWKICLLKGAKKGEEQTTILKNQFNKILWNTFEELSFAKIAIDYSTVSEKLLMERRDTIGDYLTEDKIREYEEAGFVIQKVNVVPEKFTPKIIKIDAQKEQMIQNAKNIDRNSTIVIDAQTNKVLAVLLKNAINKEEKESVSTSLQELPLTVFAGGSDLNRKIRQQNPGKPIGSASFGYIRHYAGQENHLAYHTFNTQPLLKKLGLLSDKLNLQFKMLLPATFRQTAKAMIPFKKAGLMLTPDNIYTTVQYNRGAKQDLHRDTDPANYSVILGVSLNPKAAMGAGTCFFEWNDPVTSQILRFNLDDCDALIADTDYLHCVYGSSAGAKKADFTTDRASLVFYTHNGLKRSRVFYGYDSDAEHYPIPKETIMKNDPQGERITVLARDYTIPYDSENPEHKDEKTKSISKTTWYKRRRAKKTNENNERTIESAKLLSSLFEKAEDLAPSDEERSTVMSTVCDNEDEESQSVFRAAKRRRKDKEPESEILEMSTNSECSDPEMEDAIEICAQTLTALSASQNKDVFSTELPITRKQRGMITTSYSGTLFNTNLPITRNQRGMISTSCSSTLFNANLPITRSQRGMVTTSYSGTLFNEQAPAQASTSTADLDIEANDLQL